jgi:hypothetical protein
MRYTVFKGFYRKVSFVCCERHDERNKSPAFALLLHVKNHSCNLNELYLHVLPVVFLADLRCLLEPIDVALRIACNRETEVVSVLLANKPGHTHTHTRKNM